MTYFVFDTETDGKAQFNLPPDHPTQPNLVQLAGTLYTDDHVEFASISTIVQPDGWTIPKGAEDVHGISTEVALKQGVSLMTACEVFGEFVDIADVVVCHNIKFDSIVMRRAFAIVGGSDPFAGKIMRCTMLTATPIMKIKKPTGGFKWPTLAEALAYYRPDLVNEKAHDAMYDARACAAIYAEQVKMGSFAPLTNGN